MKKIILLLLVLVLAASTQAKLSIVATTPDLGALANQIGGDRVEVTSLAKPTEDPHFVDAKPSFKVKLNRADALIEGGAELEAAWLQPLLEGARNPKLSVGQPGVIMAAEGIHLLEIPTTLDRAKGDIHAMGNPHFMSDPENGRLVAAHICNAFCQLDPASAAFFRGNLKEFNLQLDAKLAQWQRLLGPFKNRDVVSYHSSWPYFAQRFGLRIDLFLEPKPGIPPTPAHLAQVILQMKQRQASVILVQPYQDRKTAETVARHTRAKVLDFSLFPQNGETYFDWMDGLVRSLASAFLKKGS